MPAHHFTRDDLVGSTLAVVLFAVVLIAPGYVAGWLADVRGFRREPAVWRLVWSLPISVGVAPIVCYLAGSALGMRAVWVLCGLCVAAALVLMLRAGPVRGFPRWLMVVCAAWLAVAVLSGIDVQWGTRLYPPVLIYDYNLRSGFIDGISRQGLPAINPLFYPGHFVPLRYHYFWLILCSLVEQLGGRLVLPRQALIASSSWAGWAVIATVLLYLRYFRRGGDPLGRRGMWACVLLGAAGLDVLPNALAAALRWTTGEGIVYPSAEWWNNPVTGLPHASLWVAHHVAGVVACLCGFLLVWKVRLRDWSSIVVAGLCFASAVGLSIYVALAFAACVAVWTGWALAGRRSSVVQPVLRAGVVGAVVASSYIVSMGKSAGSGGPLIQPTVRSFPVLEVLLQPLHWNWTAIAAANLAFVPLNYFLEAALLMVVVVLIARRRFRNRLQTEEARAELVFLVVPFLIATFLRSGVITNNDLGWRAPLVAQLMAAVAGVDIVRAWIGRGAQRRAFVTALLVLGIASSMWDLAAMRTYPMLADAGLAQPAVWLTDRDIGVRTYAMRDLYERLQERTPRDAVVQANPNVWNQVYLGAYSRRQTASFDVECGSVMGGAPALCAKLQPALLSIFNNAGPLRVPDSVCRASGISALVFEARDPAMHGGVVDGPQIVVSNGYAKAIRCGSGEPPSIR